MKMKLQISAPYSTVPTTLAGISRADSTSRYCAQPPAADAHDDQDPDRGGSIAVQVGIEAMPMTMA